MAQVFKLFRIQQVDSQIDAYLSRIQQIEVDLKDNTRYQQAIEQVKAAENALTRKKIEIQQIENQVQALRIKFEQNQSSLYGGKIRNPKELQDLQNEASALRRQIENLEESLLELMLAADELEMNLEAARADLSAAEIEKNQKETRLNGELQQLRNNLTRLKSEREAIASTAPADELAIYQQIRTRRKGIAVAAVVDQFCSACGANLSSTLLHQAKSPNQIAYCDTCGRILYAG
jgi:predicted  nucleic acid-binding Zn-ribbon protein